MNLGGGILSAVLGLWASVYGLVTIRRGLGARPWPSVSGRITGSTVRTRGRIKPLGIGGQRFHDFTVTYSYEVRGSAWRGHRIKFGEYGFGSYGDVEALKDRYREGARVTVYYDPDNPSDAVLEPGVGSDAWVGLGVGTVLLAAGIVILTHGLR